jgi:hypothetical protein
MSTAYADYMDLIHRIAPEIRDFFNYRTHKPAGEFNDIKRSEMSMRIKDQNQSQPRLCGNQTIEGLNVNALPRVGHERQPEIYNLDVSEQLSVCCEIYKTGRPQWALCDLVSTAFAGHTFL